MTKQVRWQRRYGNQMVRRFADAGHVQPRLQVTDPNDRSEREAERVAHEVTNSRSDSTELDVGVAVEDGIYPLCTSCRIRVRTGEPLNCPECEGTLQRKQVDREQPTTTAEFERDLRSSTGGGRRLPRALGETFERRFGHDFGAVRIHDGSKAARLNREIDAQAFTYGRDIYFSEGVYQPDTKEGRRLIAHELTHVVQQGEATKSTTETVQRQFLGFDPARDLIGRIWLGLSDERKRRYIDRALDLAIGTIDRLPGKHVLGAMWPLFQEGMLGFLREVRSRGEEAKIRAVDTMARIMANQSLEYAIGVLKGIVRGFFIDGLLGIFLLIRDLVMGLRNVWRFIEWVGTLIGQFPESMQRIFDEIKGVGWTLVYNIEPAIQEAQSLFTDPGRMMEFVSIISEHGKRLSAKAGEKLADALMDFFTQPDAERATGEATGRVVGLVLFEVVFAILTAGTGLVVTALKAAGRMVARLTARITGSVLAVFRMLVGHIDTVASAVRGMGPILGSGVLRTTFRQFGNLLERLKGFSHRILRYCHESRLVCNFPARPRAGLWATTPWGRRVAQRSDINWSLARPDGMTNLEAARKGFAPMRQNPTTGKWERIQLHHSMQQPFGPLIETWASTHRKHPHKMREAMGLQSWRKLIPGAEAAYNAERAVYWKWRAGRRDLPFEKYFREFDFEIRRPLP